MNSNSLQHRRAILTMVVAAFLWSIAGVFTRHLDSAKSFEVTFWRSLFCAFTMIAWFAYTQGFWLLPTCALAAKRGWCPG